MPAPENIEDAISQTARGPARAQFGNQSVDAQDIDKMIAADEYLASKQAKSQPGFGIGIQTIKPFYP